MKTIFFSIISLMIISCKGRIPRFGTKPSPNFNNAGFGAARAIHVYNNYKTSDDEDEEVNMNNVFKMPNDGNSNSPITNLKPVKDFPKIKVDIPELKGPDLKQQRELYNKLNLKRSQENILNTMDIIEKTKNVPKMPNADYSNSRITNLKPVRDFSKIKVDRPPLKAPDLKQQWEPNNKLNLKRSQENNLNTIKILEKIKN